MKTRKNKLHLNKKTVANLNKIELQNLKGGTAESKECDVSLATDCNSPDCESRWWCVETEGGCPPTE